jgi:hypothetical protein
MKARNGNVGSKAGTAEQPVKKSKRARKLSQMTRGALLAVGLTAAQLTEEAEFFGEKFFHRNLVDRLQATSLTRYHE